MAKKPETFKTVRELVKFYGNDKVLKEFDKVVENSRMTSQLYAMRCSANVTQAELAKRLGISLDCIEMLEENGDDCLTFNMMVEVARALGYETDISFYNKKTKKLHDLSF